MRISTVSTITEDPSHVVEKERSCVRGLLALFIVRGERGLSIVRDERGLSIVRGLLALFIVRGLLALFIVIVSRYNSVCIYIGI